MNKVIKDWLKKYMPYHSERERDERAKELLSLIDQQGEPVAWVSGESLAKIGDEHTVPHIWAKQSYSADTPLYLHPPASREREALVALVAHWKALSGTRGHHLGCDCGGSPDGVHYCHSFQEAFQQADRILSEGSEG